MQTILLDAHDVRRIVQKVGPNQFMDALIQSMHETLDNFDAANTSIPSRDGFNYSEPIHGLIEWMPILKDGGAATLKLVGYHPQNPALWNLPTVLCSLLSFDTSTGHLAAMVDGTLATAMRTGAASAVASRILADSSSRNLGLVGAGAQAVTQLHAISRVFDLQHIYVCDEDPEVLATFRQRIAFLGLSAELHMTEVDEVCAEADILCTVTSVLPGAAPVIVDNNLKSNLHINAVGSDFPGKFELTEDLIRSAYVCPDFIPQALTEGECQRLKAEQLGPDFVNLVKGRSQYSAQQKNLTIFDSTGFALEDDIVLKLILRFAAELGIGRSMSLEHEADPHNPYFGLLAPTTHDLHIRQALDTVPAIGEKNNSRSPQSTLANVAVARGSRSTQEG